MVKLGSTLVCRFSIGSRRTVGLPQCGRCDYGSSGPSDPGTDLIAGAGKTSIFM